MNPWYTRLFRDNYVSKKKWSILELVFDYIVCVYNALIYVSAKGNATFYKGEKYHF